MSNDTQTAPEVTPEATPEVDLSQLSTKQLMALLSEKRKEAEAEREAARALAAEHVESATQAILQVQPVTPSEAEGSNWVGSILGGFEFTIDGVEYAVTVNVKDVKASAERKEKRKQAAKRAVA